MVYLYSLGFSEYSTIGILRNFNSKCKNESLLCIKPPCGVPDGLVNFGCQMMTHTHNVNKKLSNTLENFTISIVCYAASNDQLFCNLQGCPSRVPALCM